MHEHVLSVAGPELQPAEKPEQLGGHPVHVGVQHGLLAGVLDLLLHLFSSLGVHLLDLGRMDAAVGHQLGQRQPGDLPADGVETGEHHRFGRVVDDEVDTGEILQGADVAALAADDAALHVVGGQGHHRHGGVGHMAGRRPLDADGQDVLGPAVAFVPGLFLDGPHHLGHVVPDFVLGPLEYELGGLISASGRRSPPVGAAAPPRAASASSITLR